MDEQHRPEVLLQEALGQLQRTEQLRQREGGHKRGAALSAVGSLGSVRVGEDEFLAEEQQMRLKRGASVPDGVGSPRVPRRAALRKNQREHSSSEQRQGPPPAVSSSDMARGRASKAPGKEAGCSQRSASFARCGDCESTPALRWCLLRSCLPFAWLARRKRADKPTDKPTHNSEREMPHDGRVEEDLALGLS
jgi:hypothetical protein